MDRTNWKFGRTHINLLFIAVVLGKMCFPIVWMALPRRAKKGNPNAA